MIMRLAAELGPWIWMVLGFILLILEILAPGFFLLWIGLAAIATGTLSLALWEAAIWPWQVQVLVFLALSLAFAFAGKKVMAARGDDSDQPLLNQREKQLVGRTATLAEPIAEGHGRIKLGDTQWRVKGPDLPSGARVRVTGVEDSVLMVEAA
ncbi:MAG: NfeD family protein [Rhizobiaceae bacterium]|mgnify:CR=1 FL=1